MRSQRDVFCFSPRLFGNLLQLTFLTGRFLHLFSPIFPSCRALLDAPERLQEAGFFHMPPEPFLSWFSLTWIIAAWRQDLSPFSVAWRFFQVVFGLVLTSIGFLSELCKSSCFFAILPTPLPAMFICFKQSQQESNPWSGG